jgi:hypothetical protein
MELPLGNTQCPSSTSLIGFGRKELKERKENPQALCLFSHY